MQLRVGIGSKSGCTGCCALIAYLEDVYGALLLKGRGTSGMGLESALDNDAASSAVRHNAESNRRQLFDLSLHL
jgi:hypothetical protein